MFLYNVCANGMHSAMAVYFIIELSLLLNISIVLSTLNNEKYIDIEVKTSINNLVKLRLIGQSLSFSS